MTVRSQSYLLQLRLAAGAAGTLIARRLEPLGIDAHDFALLTQIAGQRRMTPSILAASQGIPITTMRDYVQRLVERGLARRIPNPDDGRSFFLVPTAGGLDMLALGNVAVRNLYENLDRELPHEPSEYDARLVELQRAVASVASEPLPTTVSRSASR